MKHRIPNVTAGAKIQVIDGDRFKTVAKVADTPNTLADVFDALNINSAFIVSMGERRFVTRRELPRRTAAQRREMLASREDVILIW